MEASGLKRWSAREAWPFVALGLVGAVYLWEVLTVSGVPVARDMQMFFVPQKHLLAEALRRGDVPLWTPYIGNGSPFLANVQSGVFYPPHWLYALLPFFTAFDLLVVLHFVLGGVLAFALARRLGLERVPAYVGAVTWMLGGYFASLLNLVNALQGAAWAPGVAWALLRHAQDRTHRTLALLVGILVVAALAGEPQSFVMAVGAALLVMALPSTRRGRENGDPAHTASGSLAPVLGHVALAGALVLGIVAVQLLPTLELVRESARSGGLAYGEAAAFGLQPVRLIHLLVPTDFRDPEYVFGVRSIIGRGDPWLFSIYLGAWWPILAWFAWRNRRRRREVAVWSVVGVASILVALGDHTPLFPWLFEHMPGLGSFRFPEKYLFGAAFSAALLAGWGAEGLLAGRGDRRDTGFMGVVLAAAAGLAGFVLLAKERVRAWAAGFGNDRMMEDFDYAHGIWVENLGKLVLLVALALGLWLLYRRGRLGRAAFAALVAAVVTADLFVAHRTLNPVVDRSFYESEPLIFRHVPLDELRRDYRLRVSRFDSLAGTVPVLRGVPLEAQKWVWQQVAAPNVGQLWRILQQDAWDAIKLARIRDEQDLLRAIPDAGRRWALLRLHSVKYVHSLLGLDAAGQAEAIPLDTLPGELFRLTRPLPRAYVVPRAIRRPDPVAVINAVLAPEFDPRAAVVLGGAKPPEGVLGPAAPFPGATIRRSEEEEVRVALEPDASGWLVLTDNHYPGWSAEVDGEPREIELANFFFRGVRVEPGDREVVFRYRSVPFERGRAVSFLALVAGGLLFAAAELRSRRSGGTARPPPPG